MFEEIIEIKGAGPGPTSIILAGVHGNEKCGITAFEKILPNLVIEKGTVLFGYGNPKALERNQRFMEANLNRMFKNTDLLSNHEKASYEYSRAQFLKKYLDQASALLDIHASYTPESNPFIICEAKAKKIAEYLPADLVVSGFDDIEPGGTDYYMNDTGKIGICLECGYLENPQSIVVAEQGILAFLKARGHLPNNLQLLKQSHVQMYQLYLTKTDSFVLSKTFRDFELISLGQIIGIDGVENIIAKKESVILFARNRQRIGEEAFLLGEAKPTPY